MEGSLSGHGGHFPLPHVLSGALHAGLHRAGFESGFHTHRQVAVDKSRAETRDRKFGALVSAGPFPVTLDAGSLVEKWYFPGPLDCELDGNQIKQIQKPYRLKGEGSSPTLLQYAIARTEQPRKGATNPTWIDKETFDAYLGEGEAVSAGSNDGVEPFFDLEHSYGIGIDRDSQTVEEGKFYSATSLRLRPFARLGCLASLKHSHNAEIPDLIEKLFAEDHRVVVGGEMRICRVERSSIHDSQTLPLPLSPEIEDRRVKWILLSPAIYPAIQNAQGQTHPGGWLPNWIDSETGEVRLLDGPGRAKAKRLKANGHDVHPGKPIRAKLVAARIGAPQVITGWSNELDTSPDLSGAKHAYKAVPAGSIYYFEAPSTEEARRLALVLQWHANTAGTHILNRRSTLLGEKGYGIGVCGNWQPLES